MTTRVLIAGQPRSRWSTPKQAFRYVGLIILTLLISLALPGGRARAEGPSEEAPASTEAQQQATRHLVADNVPYVHQELDTPADFYGKSSACGSTSVVMALGYLGKLTGPLGDYVPALHPTYSFGMEPAEAGLRAHGASSRRHEWASLGDIMASLDRGHLVIAGTKLTSVGHIVLILGYEREGESVRLIANDPWGNADEPGYGGLHNGAYISYSWERMAIGWSIEVLPGDPEPVVEQPAPPAVEPERPLIRRKFAEGERAARQRKLDAIVNDEIGGALASAYARLSS